MSVKIAPSILAADFSKLGEEIKMLNSSSADYIHVDIMDGEFVPNISFGFPIMEALKKHSTKPLDVHLMIVSPERYLERFAKEGADIITVHYEACTHLHRTIHQIKELGCKAGVALNPHTPISLLEDIIKDIDVVLIMSVNPGFGGQKFIPNTFAKTLKAKSLIIAANSKAIIEIDGGVNQLNARELCDNGADLLVAGNFVFSSESPQDTIASLQKI